MNDILITDIISPFLTGRYDRIKDDIIKCYKDLYISDLKTDSYDIIYAMVDTVEPVNKILTSIFVKNNIREIIDIINKKLIKL